uniref:Uncharacterized protein n=1 Tax=Avena sativa TaxID=4498 RepID=A0ACD5Z8N2_AVESA
MEQTIVRFPALPKLAALLLLFLLVPFLPPSLRALYLYLLFNVLVLALAVQAGFLSVEGLRDENKSSSSMPRTSSPNLQSKPVTEAVMTTNADHHLVSFFFGKEHHLVSGGGSTFASPLPPVKREPLIQPRGVKLLAIKDVVGVGRKLKEKIRKCPSRASIFFIGSVDPTNHGEVVDATSSSTVQEDRKAEEEKGQNKWKVGHTSSGDLMTKQELFTKADTFISNFYNQLKMQREESWNKLQDLYSYHHHYKSKT